MKLSALRRRTAAITSGAVALGAILVGAAPGTAHATPTNLGTLYFWAQTGVPPAATQSNSGTVSQQLHIDASAVCPATTTSTHVVITGGEWAKLSGGIGPLIGQADYDPTAGVPPQTATSETLADIAKDNSVAWTAGDYTVSLLCYEIDSFSDIGAFTGTLHFTDATHWSGPTLPGSGSGGSGAAATVTTVTASPSGSAAPSANVTFTATVNAAAAGTVQFKDGVANLGSPVAVTVGSSSATAAYQTTSLSDGAHSITAVFTPTDTTKFLASTSAALSYAVTAARLTTTTFTASPQSPAVPGSAVTFTATVTPAIAVGNIVFKDGNSTLGTAVVVNGTAAYATTGLTGGDHSIVAVFTPTDATQFTSSQSAAQTYTVSTAQVTVTTLSVSPVGGAAPGDPIIMTATVQPATAAGSVQFKDGASLLGVSVPVTAGLATYSPPSSSTLPIGTHMLTAVFIPTVAASFATSTSAPQYYFIGTGARTTTVLAMDPPGPVPPRTAVTLTALMTPSTATGTVQFFDGTTALGTANVVAGSASFVAQSLPIGTHPISAVYTPTDPAAYKGSASISLPLVVSLDSPPVFTTPARVNGNAVALGSVSCDASITGRDDAYAPTFVWIVNGAPVNGATDHVLQIPLSYYGRLLQCQVSASNARGTSKSPVAAAVKVGAAGRVVATVRPSLTGTFTVGHRVRVTTGRWSISGARLTYQWFRDGRAIRGAVSSSYTLSKADRRHLLTCTVTAKTPAYTTGSSTPTARRVA